MLTNKSLIIAFLSLILLINNTPVHASVGEQVEFDVGQVTDDITLQLSRDLKENSKNNPLLILVGGYPGAGKTTLINALAQAQDMTVISWNAIRQALLDRGLKGSPYDWEIIQAVNQNLLKKCLERQVNIIIDANAHARNIQLFKDLLEAEDYQNIYQFVKICLNPPEETLLSRIRSREQKEGLHQGTETDLLRDLNSKHKRLNMNDYSLIIKNCDEISFETELRIVNAFLKTYLDQQQSN